MNFEEKIKRIKDLRPIDDVFFEVLAQNKGVCEEVLQTIFGDPNLHVLETITQSSEKNLYGRSVRLDALCVLGDNSKCNIEVQRSDNDDHLRRARFNASSITTKDSEPGERFEDILDLYIVYITEFDFLKGGKALYHVDKVVRENGMVVDDGLHEIFVNTVIDDGSDISALMSCFLRKEVNNPRFPKLSNEVTRLKTTQGGASAVCEVMEKYAKEYAEEYAKEYAEETAIRTKIEAYLELGASKEKTIKVLMEQYNLTEQTAIEKYNEYAQ